MPVSGHLQFSAEVESAIAAQHPVVALESTVIAHGLPRPTNLETAQRLEQIVREQQAIPATIGMLAGRLNVGLEETELRIIAERDDIKKVSVRDLPIAVALKPRVSDVITRFQILPEDRLGLVSVVAEYRGVSNDPALSVLNFNRSGVSDWQRCDVGDQLWFVENASFFVGENAVVGEILFHGAWLPGTTAS